MCYSNVSGGGELIRFRLAKQWASLHPFHLIKPATSAMGTFPLSSVLGSALSLGFYDTLCRTSPPFLFLLYPLMSGLEDSPGQSLARRNYASM